MIPLDVTIIGLFLAFGCGALFGACFRRTPQRRMPPSGSATRPQPHVGPYIGNWTPAEADKVRRG